MPRDRVSPCPLPMLSLDLTGKRALVAGVADDNGFGFAIAKALAMAGASVCVATWPPALTIFLNLIERGKIDESRRMPDGSLLTFERIYPLDAVYDALDDAPADVRESKRYKDVGDFSIDGLAARLVADFGAQPLDFVMHSLANGPEVKKPLLEVSRAGYLAASSASAYSMVSMVQRLGPLMRPGGSFASLTYMASERAVPGYGGGMSSAKAALESDTRLLAFEAGRQWGVRVNTISAGPYASRAASAIGIIGRMVEYCALNTPIPEALRAEEVWAGGGVPRVAARVGHQRDDALRGQRLSRDGHGRRDAAVAVRAGSVLIVRAGAGALNRWWNGRGRQEPAGNGRGLVVRSRALRLSWRAGRAGGTADEGQGQGRDREERRGTARHCQELPGTIAEARSECRQMLPEPCVAPSHAPCTTGRDPSHPRSSAIPRRPLSVPRGPCRSSVVPASTDAPATTDRARPATAPCRSLLFPAVPCPSTSSSRRRTPARVEELAATVSRWNQPQHE
ncbi:MAG: enoyl-[acyl-carrier-protein] reductase [Gemmatimonadaceae bacterium]|nr:enoyl-[acyl-carrier-protein] reductase [Gemmatimonadaceae bacterium]